MPVEIALNTPLADALTNAIQPKLVEVGWGTGGADDSALAEYIILMVVNGKTQDEIAAELAGDLLNLGPEDAGAREFAKWLFDQIATLTAQQPQGEAAAAPILGDGQDSEMQMATDNAGAELTAPTGPKAMRNGNNNTNNRGGGGRERRMMGQINRALDRPTADAALHRTRGNDRINSHGRTQPNGPRGGGVGRVPRGGNMNMNMNMNTRAASIAHGMATAMGGGMVPPGPGPMGMVGMPPMPNGWMGPGGPRQEGPAQMQLLQIMEQQQQMMQHLQQQLNQQTMIMQQGGNTFQQANGKSLRERIQHPRQNNGNGNSSHNNNNHRDNNQFRKGPGHQQNGAFGQPSSDAATGEGNGADGANGEDVDMQQSQPQPKRDPKETVCAFNLGCTKRECEFAHQSPAAPPGTTVDVTDTCTFGAACKNHKCVGSHPSPAAKAAHQSEMDCKFWPNCTNPSCTFKHPSAPPCRNGADCSVPNCRFTHSKTVCRYRPCKNRYCPFKHEEGQKGTFADKVWTADGSQPGPHVSERKFADDNAEVETIIPGQGDSDMAASEGVAVI